MFLILFIILCLNRETNLLPSLKAFYLLSPHRTHHHQLRSSSCFTGQHSATHHSCNTHTLYICTYTFLSLYNFLKQVDSRVCFVLVCKTNLKSRLHVRDFTRKFLISLLFCMLFSWVSSIIVDY